MQANYVVCGQTYAREPVEQQVTEQIADKVSVIDRIADWLEREEPVGERAVGYVVCGLAMLYLLGSLIRAVL